MTEIDRYLAWLADRGHAFDGYASLHRWSVTDLDGFWSSIKDFFGVRFHSPETAVVPDPRMPGTEWFPGATLNYAEHALGSPTDDVAVIAYSQTRERVELTWGELRDQVARARAGLRRLGVRRGDRVVAYLPNIPETVVAYLAVASLGAIWASCAPEFGARSVVDRFGQIEPRVLLTVSGYRYGAKDVDRRAEVAAIRASLPTVEHVVHVPYGEHDLPGTTAWRELLAESAPGFEPVGFAHPLCVLFSSGTTGKPKAIVHGHGGLLLEHLKNHGLSWDLRPGDRMLWFSTTAWMMWNALVSGLLTGTSIVLVDGNPLHPDLAWQWRLAAETRATLMGASPGFLMACRKAGLDPAASFDLSALRQLGAAGSPLPAEGYHWVRDVFGPDVLLNVGSGGTDVCSGIVQGSPLQPVVAGEISGPCLGVDAKAFDEAGNPVVGELGELVITAPMPSMPVGFWGDDTGERYRETYFDTYPGVWRHGDWIRFSPEGSCVIAGRSDATLNRGGVRLGTAEFYAVVEELPEVEDSLVVHLEDPAGGNGDLRLFVVLRDGDLDTALRTKIATALKSALSPRHVPDTITAVPVIPRNRTGKKLELPVKKLLLGARPEDVVGADVLADPTALDHFGAPA
ncbi:acetoacetate--CoA ligase [Amycolatopsis sp. SID8362]|uniref:acetoacetate--CoA ligase n=1 Tax=Amycolatopsis sp. SID8362 TaxID=2690346 RepID=UPI0013710732|nr:acetoacetate--CoA ligase [Amycolatopsis sp. SID8362]NBH09342.1 acetoacetate--CoA ligase [Amycolatopsis sp. SID8362]NED46035.1 acetoacetate--CoA ligase [Amycolatopsis sp. SID8362]